VVCGTRGIPRDVLIERAACATGLGDAIGVVLRNNFAFFETSFATQRLGSYSLPVNWHGKTQETAYVLNDCGAGAVVAHTGLLPEVALAMPPGCRSLSCRRYRGHDIPARAPGRFQGPEGDQVRNRIAARGPGQDHQTQIARAILRRHRAEYLDWCECLAVAGEALAR
jgi:acyl-CoA synthetase (AMP-forming)/AMP-acid ligase II